MGLCEVDPSLVYKEILSQKKQKEKKKKEGDKEKEEEEESRKWETKPSLVHYYGTQVTVSAPLSSHQHPQGDLEFLLSDLLFLPISTVLKLFENRCRNFRQNYGIIIEEKV